ncbi:MAG: hypothetical protein K0R29_1614 [Pseudobdellovibrio sp.]|jgi:hypothetical protein|nr:hypothetical protein [Pseudobdellovibrio sp.]
MKTLILISATALGLMGVGCSKSNTGAANATNNNTITNVPGPILVDPNPPTGNGGTTNPPASGTTTTSGSTVDFTISSIQAMRDYVQPASPYQALNNPTNVKIQLNLQQADGGRYGGDVTISYTDNGQQFSGTLSAGLGTNPELKGGYDNGKLQAEYNYFFTHENKLVFTGFFEDRFGSIVLSLEPGEPVGGGNDAEPLSVPYKGKIYFKNFRNTYGQYVMKNNPYRSCWFIYTGVFDCRSNNIQSKCALEPGVEAGYTLLGSFTNVDIKKAFNIN